MQLPPNDTWNVDVGGRCGTEVWYSVVVYDHEIAITDVIQSRVERVPYPLTNTNLSQLTANQVYEIRLATYNWWGTSEQTPPYDVPVGEAGKSNSRLHMASPILDVPMSY